MAQGQTGKTASRSQPLLQEYSNDNRVDVGGREYAGLFIEVCQVRLSLYFSTMHCAPRKPQAFC